MIVKILTACGTCKKNPAEIVTAGFLTSSNKAYA
jgi:hypothetical protein